jgi:hypothetical protein
MSILRNLSFALYSFNPYQGSKYIVMAKAQKVNEGEALSIPTKDQNIL